jgi:hypothetical protein
MKKQYLAIVPTRYETYAVAGTEKEAKRKALTSAREWVNAQFAKDGVQPFYKTNAEVEDYLGVGVYELDENGLAREG